MINRLNKRQGMRPLCRIPTLETKFILVIVAIGLTACSLLNGPATPVIPTPPPLSSVEAIDFENLENVAINPTSELRDRVDPDILTLVNSVSRQQLVGYVQTLESFGTRHSLSDTQREDYGIGAARNWIFNELDRVGAGRLQVRFDDFQMNFNGLTSDQRNVVATLPGQVPEAGAIVLMAHYDTRTLDPADGTGLAPGANDNGSGVALMMEIARLMSSRTWNQTVIFIAFTGEEQGTKGSFSYVQRSMLNGLSFDAAINNDIVGGRPGIPQSIRVFALGPETSPSVRIARYMSYMGEFYTPNFVVDWVDALDRPERYSDHREFLSAGVGAIRLTESVEDPTNQHNARDTSEKLDYDYLVTVTQLNLATVATMAGSPPRPAPPTVTGMADPGAYLLTWSPDPLASAYAIAFRPAGTFSYPEFQYASFAEAGSVAITGLDPAQRYYVSISAIDGSGRISLPSEETLVGP